MNEIDLGGVATLLHRSREHVRKRIIRRPDFPTPVQDINGDARGMRWRYADVLHFKMHGGASKGKARGKSS